MLPIALAFVSALVWGSSDYCGGRATARGDALSVTVVSQLLGLPVLLLCLPILPGQAHPGDLVWGAGAGAAGFFGITLLYRGLATGAMAIVAPVTAVTSALVPLLVGLATGDRPGALALTGAVCAIVAIGLVSLGAPPAAGASRAEVRVVGLALAAGTFFGLFFVLIAQSDPGSGVWSLVGARTASVLLGGLLLIVRASRGPGPLVRLPRPGLLWVAAAGAGDITANALYLLAARGGALSIVAPIAALYPVSTVLLAVTLDRERVRASQLLGLGLAATALVLTAV